MSEVVFRGVGKVYSRGETAAVEDFSLDVRDGEFLVLVGPSGCGQSTTLHVLNTVTFKANHLPDVFYWE